MLSAVVTAPTRKRGAKRFHRPAAFLCPSAGLAKTVAVGGEAFTIFRNIKAVDPENHGGMRLSIGRNC